jgi:hypothetical protein
MRFRWLERARQVKSLHTPRARCFGGNMNELDLINIDLYPCGCSNHQNFNIIKRVVKKGREVYILKCANCYMNTGFQPTIERASKVWNECHTSNNFEMFDDIAPTDVKIIKE